MNKDLWGAAKDLQSAMQSLIEMTKIGAQNSVAATGVPLSSRAQNALDLDNLLSGLEVATKRGENVTIKAISANELDALLGDIGKLEKKMQSTPESPVFYLFFFFSQPCKFVRFFSL